MTTTSRETLDRLEQDAEQARARVSSQLAQVRHRLEPEAIKHQAQEAKDRLMVRARDSASQYIEERKRRLKQTVLDTAMNNPAPALAVGTLVAWSLWGRLSRIPAPILLIGAGGLAGLMRWKDGSSPTDQRTYPADYWEAQLEQARPRGERTGRRLSSIGEPASQAAGRARELASEAGTRISEASARAGSAVSDMAGRTAEATARAGSAVSDMAGRRAGRWMAGRTAGEQPGCGRCRHDRQRPGPAGWEPVLRSLRAPSLGARRSRARHRRRHSLLVPADRDRSSYARRDQRQVQKARPRDGRRANSNGRGRSPSGRMRRHPMRPESRAYPLRVVARRRRSLAGRPAPWLTGHRRPPGKSGTPRLRSDAAGGRKPTPKEVLLRQSGGRRPAERQPSAGCDRVTCRLWRQ